MSDSTRKTPPLVAERRYGRAAPKSGGAKSGGSAKPPAKPPKPSRKTRRPRGPLGWLVALPGMILRAIWAVTWRLSLVAGVILFGVVYVQSLSLPPVDRILDGRARGSVTMLDQNGEVFALRGAQFGGAVTADSVSPHLKNAVIAIEDKRFYRHFGVSPRGVLSAMRINMREGRHPLRGNGGSTITQQTAKLLCMGEEYDTARWPSEQAYEAECRQSTLSRKGREAIYAMAMELAYTKDEILSIYLNRAYMGGGAYGAEAAAQRFFGKPAAAVTAPEAAILAGLLTAPTALAPTTNLQRSQNRAAVVIAVMRDEGYLTEAEAARALANPATLSDGADRSAGGYFADWVMSSGPDYFTRNTAEDVIIRTTLDPRLQRATEDALTEVFATRVREGSKAEAAIVVMSPDGAVRAMVGGRNTRVVGAFNRATQASRQTGSAFKPFVYAAALDSGYTGNDIVEDAPLTIDIPGSGPWSPENYDRTFNGYVTLTEAFATSLNIPAVKVAQSVGLDRVRAIASGFGVGDDLATGPALALGVSESTLVRMTGAYAGILNGGYAVVPYGLVDLRLRSDNTALISQTGGLGAPVISEDAARQMVWMMHQVVQTGTGGRANLPDREVGGKTGTTQAARDAWFIGFSADYVAGVWMGYDDNTPLSGVTGAGLPSDIWREVMLRVHDGLPPRPLPMQAPASGAVASGEVVFTPQGSGGSLIEDLLRGIFGGGGGGQAPRAPSQPAAPEPDASDRR